MATYTQYSQSWLEDSDSIKIVLVVAQVYNVTTATTNTLYFSNAGYVTSDGLISFDARIRRSVTLSETLSSDGGGAMTFGDIELDNQNGELDTYLDSSKYVWSNKPLVVYYGDPRWVCTSVNLTNVFLTIFNGVVDDVDSRSRASLNLKIRDKLERLNTAVTEDKLGTVTPWGYGGQQNQDSIKPLVFGEAFNITPLLINPNYGVNLRPRYQFNNGVSEQLIEIRDNGVPIYNSSIANSQITVDLQTGTFVLYTLPRGTVTCSVQGVHSPVDLALSNNTPTLTLPTGYTQAGNLVTKTAATSVWDISTHTSTAYTDGAGVEILRSRYLTAPPATTTAQTALVIGLTTTTNTAQLYTTTGVGALQYAFHDAATGTTPVSVYISGVRVATTDVTISAPTPTSKLAIKYNGYTVGWYVDDVLVHSVTAAANLTLYGHLSLRIQNSYVSSFKYSPFRYVDTIADLVTLLATQYGKLKTATGGDARLLVTELDYANLNDFNTNNTQSVAAVVTDTQNVLTACRALANSVMAQIFITRTGLLQLLKYGVPYPTISAIQTKAAEVEAAVAAAVAASTTTTATLQTPVIYTITEQDIKYNSFAISSRPGLQAAYKLAYGKNYAVQNNLITQIPETHKDSYKEEWLTVSKTDSTIAGLYSLPTDVTEVTTQLVSGTDADTECQRRLDYYKTQHTVYKFTGTARLLGLQLGQQVNLTHSRFNLALGVNGQVVTLSPNWTTGSVEVEVLI